MTQAASSASAPDAPYWRALAEGHLKMPRCSSCKQWQWPAVSRCAECGGWDAEWIEQPIEGKLYSWIKTHYAFAGSESLKTPYVTVLVELPNAGGKRLMGLFEGDDSILKLETPLKGRIGSTFADNRDIPCLVWRAA